MLIEPEISAVSVVLVGDFNPPIFTPSWFARYELISEEDADEADVAVIHKDVTQFKVSFFLVTVQTDKFQLQTTEAPFIRLNDLIQRIFGELLPHTPLRMAGINREVHVNVGGQDVRDHIGKVLAPPQAWGDWAEKIVAGGIRHGGMRSLTMFQNCVEGREKGSIQAIVQPSVRIPDNSGIFISVNDHFEASSANEIDRPAEVLRFVGERFDASIRNSEHIIDQVLRLRHG